MVIKSGRIQPHEALTLAFIAANTTIPVPRVREIHYEEKHVSAIVMDYMPGKRLDEAWVDLDTDQKRSIADQLHSYMTQLRSLKGTYIGAINRGPAFTGQRAVLEGGPFDSEQEFNKFILGYLIKSLPNIFRHYAESGLMDDHEIVFTHGDFAPRNILVEGDRVTAIIDWEFAGWYPEHWEYMRAFRDWNSMPDWSQYLVQMLPIKYEREFLGMTFVNQLSRDS